MGGGRERGRSPLPVSENWKKCLDFGKTPKLLYVVDETSRYVLLFQETSPALKNFWLQPCVRDSLNQKHFSSWGLIYLSIHDMVLKLLKCISKRINVEHVCFLHPLTPFRPFSGYQGLRVNTSECLKISWRPSHPNRNIFHALQNSINWILSQSFFNQP